MGYKAKRKVYRLQFSGELEGLEVRARSISMGKMMEIADGMEALETSGLLAARQVVETFVSAVESWNLQHEDGAETPITYEGLVSHDPDLVMELTLAWQDAITGTFERGKEKELGKDSTSGGSFPEGSIPMETPSPSLAS